MATSTELLRAAEHMRKRADDTVHGTALARHYLTSVDALEREAARLRSVEARRRKRSCPDITDDMFMTPHEVMQVIQDFTSHPREE